MDKKEAKRWAKKILEQYHHGVGAGQLLELVGERDFNAVLRELMKLGNRSCNCNTKEGDDCCDKTVCKRKARNGKGHEPIRQVP